MRDDSKMNANSCIIYQVFANKHNLLLLSLVMTFEGRKEVLSPIFKHATLKKWGRAWIRDAVPEVYKQD